MILKTKKKSKKKTIHFYLLLVFLLLLTNSIFLEMFLNLSSINLKPIQYATTKPENSELHNLEPFIIDDLGEGNYTWLEASYQPWCSGKGTEADPYIIQSIYITADATHTCLVIKNSNVHFIIKNSTFFIETYGGSGISLQNASYGKFFNNSLNNGIVGLDLLQCDHIEFYNISVHAHSRGFLLDSCSNISISSSYIENPIYGIRTSDCQYLHIFQNLIEFCTNTGMLIGGNNNIIEDNIVQHNSNTGLILSGCNNKVINNNIYNNGWGSFPGYYNGIYIYQYSNSNNISRNLIHNQQYSGIYCNYYSENNLIYDNFFFNNGENAKADQDNNHWNNSLIGNYWDDYLDSDTDNDGIGDNPYDVETSPLIQDFLPIHGNPFYDGSAILIDGSQSSGPTSWQWISTRYWCQGLGSSVDPYVIKNLTIDGEKTEICFEIRNSNVFFILQDCSLYNSTYAGLQDPGLKLDTVTNGIIINNHIYDNQNGIYLRYCNDSSISNNIINDNSKYGVYVFNGFYNNITNNIIQDNSHGIRFHSSTNNRAIDNLITLCSYGFSFQYGHDNILSNNRIFNSTIDGFYLFSSDRNTIKGNLIQNTSRYGIYTYDSSNDNLIYLNQFAQNDVNAYDATPNNQWDNGSIGNYWDDYNGGDLDDNGIGDDPHPIPGTVSGSQDNFPIWEDGIDGIIIDESTEHDWTWALSHYWCTGSGTINDPYVIEDITINGRDSGSCIEIRNSDKYFIIRNTTLYNASAWIAPFYHSAIRLENVRNGRLESNNGSQNNGYGFYLVNCNYTQISGNTLTNNSDYAIQLDLSHHNNLTNNLIANNSDVGIGNYQSNHNSIIDNRILMNRLSGIYLDFCEGIEIYNNTVVENNDIGIRLYDSLDTIISENKISRNRNSGIFLQQSENNSLLRNECYNNTEIGVYLYESPNNTLLNNIASKNEHGGIFLYQCDGTKLFSNNISGSEYEALRIDLSNDIILFNNEVRNNLDYAIYMTMCNHSLIESNRVKDNMKYGIYMQDVEDTILLNNIAEFNMMRGIYIWEGRNITISKNNITNNQDSGLYLNNCNQSKVINNIIANNKVFGCYIKGYDNNFSDNIIHSNQNTGLFSYNCRESIIHQNFVYNNSQDGIAVELSNTMIVSSNQVYNNSKNGFITDSIYYSTFLNNNIHENHENGIMIWDNNENNTFIENNVSYNSNYGIYLYYANGNNFTHNDIFENHYEGIYLRYSHENRIISNKLKNNWGNGIELFYSNSSEIRENNLISNGVGLRILHGEYNIIYYNNFTGNGNNAEDSGSYNSWDDGVMGNYWDDYSGVDTDDDGIGDTPYIISGSAASQDNYPLWDDGIEPLPGPFTLSSSADNPDDDGIFDLIWTESSGTDNYSIYRHSKFITILNESLSLVMNQNASSPHSITGLTDGSYYYVVVAYNETGYTLSNCILVIVEFPPVPQPPGAFTLTSNADSPDTDGSFELTWTSSSGADNYSLYLHTTLITEINESILLLIDQMAVSPQSISGLADGTYYYIVLAMNEQGTILSNCITIIVEHPSNPSPPSIPGYEFIYIIISIITLSFALRYQFGKKIRNHQN